MVEYRLPDDVVRHLAFPRWLLASVVCVAIYAAVFLLVPPSIAFHRDSGFLLTMGLTCIIWVCTYAIVIRHRFSSMRIRLTDYTIGTIRKDIWRSTFFHIDDVAGIEERPGKGLVVRSSSGRHIDVPAQIIGYAEIRAALEKWQPIHVIAGS